MCYARIMDYINDVITRMKDKDAYTPRYTPSITKTLDRCEQNKSKDEELRGL